MGEGFVRWIFYRDEDFMLFYLCLVIATFVCCTVFLSNSMTGSQLNRNEMLNFFVWSVCLFLLRFTHREQLSTTKVLPEKIICENQGRPLEKPACRPPLLSLHAKHEFKINM